MSPTNDARVSIATGDGLDVRRFSVQQGINQLFRVELRVMSTNLDVDFDAVIGQQARFELSTEWAQQHWTGICLEMEQVRADPQGLATYRLVIVPQLWFLTQRKNFRIFQYQSELEIVQKLLGEWGIEHESLANASAHKGRKFRVQYDESDFTFISRMLEDAGISYYFTSSGGNTKLVLDDEPETRALGPTLTYRDTPQVSDGSFATQVAVRSRLRPGKLTVGDLDYRRMSTRQPTSSASGGLPQEAPLEQFEFEPGAFLYTGAGGGNTPSADDRGAARTDDGAAQRKAKNRLFGKRNDAKVVTFESNVLSLEPGAILSVVDHPHRALTSAPGLLVTHAAVEGDHSDNWRVEVEAVSAEVPYRPEVVTPKPQVRGLESATVVGPGNEEIYTDEFARVRVHFHWDRESRRDQNSSCWLPTNQPWSGKGYGAVNLPRIGQEVLVEFLGGDPDRPVVIGRVYTESNPVPDPLPKYKRVSGLFSESTPRLVMGAAGGADGIPARSLHPGGTPMSPSEINGQVSNAGIHQAPSPTGVNHQWAGSGMKLDDQNGVENFYLQANKDMHWVIRNDWKTVVGNHRAAFIGTDESVYIRGNQTITIGSDQDTLVQRDQTNIINGNRKDKVTQKFTQTVTKGIKVESRGESLAIKSEDTITFKAEKGIELKVNNSNVKIEKELITIDGGDSKVHINPSYRRETFLTMPSPNIRRF